MMHGQTDFENLYRKSGMCMRSFKYVTAGLIFCSSLTLNADAPEAKASSDGKPPYDADLFNKDKSVYFANAEFLYWLANEGAVDYAVKMKKPAWSSTASTFAVGNYRNAQFDWSPGFRVNFGYFRAPHFWDVYLQYTYVPSSGVKTAHAPSASNEFLNGTWIQPDLDTGAPPAPLKKARCHIDMKYNVLDFLFTRRFHTNEHLRFNVFGGLTSALIFQKMKISYTDINALHSHIENRWRFEGVGFRGGVQVDWYMGYDIFMVGTLSTAALSGWYKNTAFQNTTLSLPDADSSRPIRNSRFHDIRLTYMAQFMVGPSWQKRFKNMRTAIVLGYELNIWANLHQIYRSGFGVPTAAKETFINNSNISLQGLTLRMNLDF